MPTSHGSLDLQGPRPGAPPTRSTWPACGRRAGSRSARRRPPSSAPSASPRRRRGASPATRGTRTRTPGGSSGGSAAAVAAGLVPVATASDGGRLDADPGRLLGPRRPQAEPRPHPAPRAVRVADGRARDAHDHRGRQRSPPRHHRRPGRRRPPVAPGQRRCATRSSSRRSRWLGCAPAGPSTSASSSTSIRRSPGSPRRPHRRSVQAAGLELDGKDVVLTDPVRTWLSGGAMDLWFSIDEDMWPDVADDLTRYSRDSLEGTKDLPGVEVRPRRPASRAAHARRGPVVPARSTSSSRRPPLCRRSRPRARRRAAPWPRRSRCWRTCAGTRRSRCPPGSRATASRSGSRSPSPGTGRARPAPGPDLRADPALAAPRPIVALA